MKTKEKFPLWHKLFLLSVFITLAGGALCLLLLIILQNLAVFLLDAVLLIESNHLAQVILKIAKRDYLKQKAMGRKNTKADLIFSGVDFLPYHLPELLLKQKEQWQKALQGTLNYLFFEDFKKNKEFKILKKKENTFVCFGNKEYPISLADLSNSEKEPIWGWNLLGYYKNQPIYKFIFLKDNIFSYDSIALQTEFPPEKGVVWQRLMYKVDELVNFRNALGL